VLELVVAERAFAAGDRVAFLRNFDAPARASRSSAWPPSPLRRQRSPGPGNADDVGSVRSLRETKLTRDPEGK